MKIKVSLFLLLIFTLFNSCRDDDNESNKVLGEWKLMKVEQYVINASDEYESSTTDYSSQDNVYNFQSNNTLIVSGGENVGYTNGTYSYVFKKDYISYAASDEEPKVEIVEIDGSKWVYNYSNSQMSLSLDYVDGPKLIFEKK